MLSKSTRCLLAASRKRMAPKAEARGLIIAISRPRRLCWSGIGCPGHSEDWNPSECPPCSLPRHPLATLTLSSLLHPWRMASHEPLIAQGQLSPLVPLVLTAWNIQLVTSRKATRQFEIHGTPKISSTGSTRFMAEIRNNPSVLSRSKLLMRLLFFSAKNSLGSTREFFAAQVWRESTHIYTYEIHRTKVLPSNLVKTTKQPWSILDQPQRHLYGIPAQLFPGRLFKRKLPESALYGFGDLRWHERFETILTWPNELKHTSMSLRFQLPKWRITHSWIGG